MTQHQEGILLPVPRSARYLFFAVMPGADARPALKALSELADGSEIVVGLGQPLVAALDREIPGLRTFPAHAGPAVDVPSTPCALWCWLRGDDRGELVHLTRKVQQVLSPAFRMTRLADAFRYRSGFDLSGYEDGTENPEGTEAMEAALVSTSDEGLAGGSFVAVQQWEHDLDRLDAMPPADQDLMIGRRKTDNVELEDAPLSAHVKRTAQEDFDPPAFVLRRSMPWAEGGDSGLIFVAFGHSFDAFEAQLNRMVGADDGTPDALFRFTRPVLGAYFWCPPVRDAKLNLRAIGLD